MTISLSEWVAITAKSKMPLYAVLSNVSAADAVKNYYVTDGSQTPFGLYSQTPYENWFSVMPMIVKLDENSPFLNWISQTEYQDWGWLARSHLPFESICAHLRGLTQVIMPEGETVFFRYWDGEYLTIMLDYFADDWQNILPAFAFYWINGEPFTFFVPEQAEAQVSPWWQVHENLLAFLSIKNKTPYLENILQYLKQAYPDIYFAYELDILTLKIEKWIDLPDSNQKNDLSKLIQQLKNDSNWWNRINNGY